MNRVTEFTGETFQTPKGGTLRVLEHNGLKGCKRKYECICSICSGDTELFSEDFFMKKDSLTRGLIPCGCGGFTYNETQQVIRVNRECKLKGYDFLGWSGNYKGRSTKLSLYNPVTNNTWHTTSIDNFLTNGRGDPVVGRENTRLASTVEWVGRSKTSPKGGTITITEELSDRTKMRVHCTECEKDHELFGRGFFDVYKGAWDTFDCVCGCRQINHWSKEQYEVLLHRRECEVNGESKFLGFIGDGRVTSSSFVIQECLLDTAHGVWDTTCLKAALNPEGGCPSCANGGYDADKRGNFYVVEWFNSDRTIRLIKIGITGLEVLARIKGQLRYTDLDYKILHTWSHKDGGFVAKVEKDLKKILKPLRIVPKELLPDGYTEAVYYKEEVLKQVYDYVDSRLNSENAS